MNCVSIHHSFGSAFCSNEGGCPNIFVHIVYEQVIGVWWWGCPNIWEIYELKMIHLMTFVSFQVEVDRLIGRFLVFFYESASADCAAN